ncbi:unnamed protein product [Arctia plantaginis]|uniref:Uncharacterized protein n=1 Tax=Arctia plantaginis TaxID=874455 RepID=A0A8S0Z6Z0_ARCPL|nr:unnamed protein product [Arctia plantaginis]
MELKKCSKCKKNITKKSAELECSRCEKVVHAESACVKLSTKQLNTLRNSPGIEWSCEDCLKNLPHRSSFMIPEASVRGDHPMIRAVKLRKHLKKNYVP